MANLYSTPYVYMCRQPFKHKQVGLCARTLIIGIKPCLISRRLTVTVAISIFLLGGDIMLKLQYPICCGVDVHKNLIVATDSKGISEYEQKSFSTINSDIQKFHNWLIKNNCYHVCMESTGKYWIPIFNYLETDIDVCLTHPKYVKAIKGKKTDKKDSRWIADLYKFDLVRSSFIPPKDFR